jgi:hypothetical protein
VIDEGGGGSTNGGGGDMDWVLIAVLLRGDSGYGPSLGGGGESGSRRGRRTAKAVDGDDTPQYVGPIIDAYDPEDSASVFQET